MTAQILPDKGFYTSTEAARLLGVSPTTLRRWEEEGRITPLRTIGGDRRYSQKDVQSILTSFRKETDQRQTSFPPAGPSPAPSGSEGDGPPLIPIRQLEHYRPAENGRKLARKIALLTALMLVFGYLFAEALPPLTRTRIERAFMLGPQNPIADVNDVAEYRFRKSGELRLGFKLPVDIATLFAGSARFLGTVFFGDTESYYIQPTGSAAFKDITISGQTIKQAAVGTDAGTLGSLDSTQFLRSDTSDSFTSGILTISSGAALDVRGALALPSSGINGAGAGSGLDADTLDTLDSLQLLRSDASDSFTSGALTFEAGTTLDVLGSFTCTDCIDDTHITDIYLFNSGDTATGDYNFDTDTFVIDSVADRIGIGTASPGHKLTVLNSNTSINSLRVESDTGDGRGFKNRFSIENNSLQESVDINFREAVVGFGAIDPGVSAQRVQIGFFRPTGSGTGNYISAFAAGEDFNDIPIFAVSTGGAITLGVGGVSSTALLVKARSDSQSRMRIDEFGKIQWGAGGASAVDTNLYRNSADTLRTDDSLIVDGSVGIGTTVPNYPLEVAGIAYINRSVFGDPSSENGFRIKLIDTGGTNNDTGIGISGDVNAPSMWFNNDPDGDIRFLFGTNGEKVTFKGGGNVGIATTAPAQMLSLGTTTNTVSALQRFATGNGVQSRTWEAGVTYGGVDTTGVNYSFMIDDLSRAGTDFVIRWDTGNVGIGTAGPQGNLHIQSSDTTNSERLILSTNSGSAPFDTGIEFWTGATEEPNAFIRAETLVGGSGVLHFGTGAKNNPGTKVTIDNTGRVGIGTASPSSLLHLKSSGDAQIEIQTTGADPASWAIQTDAATGDLQFVEVGFDNRMVIQEGGFVGIGTSGPAAKLNVEVDGTNDGIRITSNVDSKTAYLRIAGGSRELFQLGGLADSVSKIQLGTNVISAAAVTIDSSDNMGIGRDPAINRLEVEGAASKTTAGDWLANSDSRIKTDVQTVEGALEVLDRLRPVSFRYTEEYMEAHPDIKDQYYYNFIAQEFQEVFPDAVQDSGDGYFQLDAYAVRPYLVAAVQELNHKVQELEMRIDGEGDAAQSNPDGSTAEITAETVEAEEGLFERLTATVLGTFEKLVAKTAEIASAVIQNLTVERLAVKGDTVGQAVIPAGETEVAIGYPDLTEETKVFFTLDRAVAAGVEKTPGSGFKFILSVPTQFPVTIDYWIVEQDSP